MICDICHQREALVHLTSTVHIEGVDQAPSAQKEQHLCRECADEYFARTPGMNASRGLVCLSDWYRAKLYDLLEAAHPESFDNSTAEACERGSEVMRSFLREHLTRDKIQLNEDAFEMLCADFFGSHHFYARIDDYNRRKG